MPSKIRDIIIAPSLPGAHHAVMARAGDIGFRCDRLKIPWELVRDSPRVRNAIVNAAEMYIKLHDGETVHVFTRPGFVKVAGDIADEWYEYGRSRGIAVTIRAIEILHFMEERPGAIVWTCGDGRPWFWRSYHALHRQYDAPRIITPPGEEQWLLDHPESASDFEGWLHEQGSLPRVVVKHGGPADAGGGCGYRALKGFSGTPTEEKSKAFEEASDPKTEYLWQPGFGEKLLVLLKPRLTD